VGEVNNSSRKISNGKRERKKIDGREFSKEGGKASKFPSPLWRGEKVKDWREWREKGVFSRKGGKISPPFSQTNKTSPILY